MNVHAEERRKENAVVMTSQKREKINLSSALASLKAAYTKTITEGKVIEYERLQGAIARLNDKLYETRMKRSQFAEKSQAEICQIIASRHHHIIANLERVQAVMGEIAELTGINDFMDDPNDIPTIMARLNEGMLSLDFQMPKLESLNNGDGSLPIEHCIERWKRLIDDVTSSSSVHRLMGLHSIVEEACQA